MTGGSDPVLDTMQVADLVALDRGQGRVFAKLVNVFLSGAEDRIVQLRRHAESADAAALADAAHALRGSSGSLGAVRLADLCARVEIAGKRQDIHAAKALIALLDAEYALARCALLAVVDRGTG
ncbi:MAG: Hpt domain-containing protein [Betaproteobacteria bacterium]|nr:Hpt domain-containing protein [Betaproteobacteria bacterium]